ncbi:SCO1664 family protein [Cellulomonas bogoriensis]|uniref:Phosphatidylinositol kinase n=1 Tax=Cellulomonas bogoriensis 69B4 = DSM 16987 TaxID=1386082 RepID=A0A0A0BQ46_9CELL|nr:SCO1664 family protein [Cellulomonas bogoriensis]KGM09199.1 phosphatidylinositol kinase [Cellulomonas bogoriensis 69B4 = DSM 16987]
MTAPDLALDEGELELVGRLTAASNATFVGQLAHQQVVYKPVAGERPLWDFPDGTLAAREVGTYLVSRALGWDVVPRTWLRDGPLGPGMVQVWQEPDTGQDPVDVVPVDQVPTRGWRTVLEGADPEGRAVAVVHEDTAPLRRMAVLDVLVNNADRKGGHVLPRPDGHRYGVDHGVTFHVEPKLRTVLWGWVGEPLDPEDVAGVRRVLSALGGGLDADLRELLTGPEIDALADRCERLLADGHMPGPTGDMPPVPWPLF